MTSTATPAANAILHRDIHAKARFNMVEGQIRTNRVSDAKLLSVLSDMPRQLFVPPALASVAYVDKSLKIAPGRYLLEPLVLGRLIQEAVVEPEDKALVVGAGAGYSAAVLARLAASVVALESDPALATAARRNLEGVGATNAVVEEGALTEGLEAGGPYDIILIDGMIASLPERISAQLAERGRLVTICSQEGRCGAGMLYRKLGGGISGRVLFDAATPFLPGFAPEPAFAF
jgi:protein-L-isoaspartate(D-aspartate) O-methyltransferase